MVIPSTKKLKKTLLILLLCSASLWGAAFPVFGEAPPSEQMRQERHLDLLAPPDTSSPRATLKSFLDNMNSSYALIMKAHEQQLASQGFLWTLPETRKLEEEGERYFARAVQCLDLRMVPRIHRKDMGYETAFFIKGVLDRVPLPPWEEIPATSQWNEGGGEKAPKENPLPLSWRIPGTELELHFVQEEHKQGGYLFSAHTVSQAQRLYRRAKPLPYQPWATPGFYDFYDLNPGRLLPPKWTFALPAWSHTLVWGQTLWQWISLAFTLGLFFLLSLTLFRLFFRKGRQSHTILQGGLNLLLPLGTIVASLATAYIISDVINIAHAPLAWALTLLSGLRWVLGAWSVVLAGNLLAEIIVASPRIDPQGIDASLVRSFAKLFSILVALGIIINGGTRLGLSLLPMLTGLGVAGLAISLAARPTIENVIGGVILFADRSIRVGETCSFGDTVGTVINIGLRTTRMRGLDRTLISIPNADLAQFKITNLSRRDRIRMKFCINLRYETTPDQLRWVLAKLREMLTAHERVHREDMRVRLVGFGASSLDVEVQAFINTRVWSDFLAIQEDLYLRMMDIIAASGTSFAFPSQTTYFAKDPGLDADRSQKAEEVVAAWRQEQKLPFPDMPPTEKRALEKSIPYPPEGSSSSKD